ncbi:MAG TPA: hypothetical protein VGG30_12450, partial [Pirellulales bacterium]
RKRPLWYYGILCLMMAALPSIAGKPVVDPSARLERMSMMLFFSAVGFGLIGWNAYTLWRDNRKL